MPGYFTLTGNPFVDAGIFVLSELVDKSIKEITPEDLKEPNNFQILKQHLQKSCIAKIMQV